MKESKKSRQERLLDTYVRGGTNDASTLADVIGELAKSSEVFRFKGEQINIYCLTLNTDGEPVVKECPANPMLNGSGRFVSLSSLKCKGAPMDEWSAELQEEAVTLDRIFIGFTLDNGDYVFMPATSQLSGDFALLGINGLAAQNPSYHLLGLVAELMQGRKMTIITRKVPGKTKTIYKCIGLRSGQYAYVPQDEALRLVFEVCADGDLVSWNVTNFLTDVLFRFNQHAVTTYCRRKAVSAVPYIRIQTSDSGESSFAFELGWDINGNDVFLATGTNRVWKTHRGEWNDAERNKLYEKGVKLKDKFTIFEDRMKELDAVTVLNENIERTVKNLCGDAKIANRAVQEAFAQHVTAEFAGTDATAAEIVLSMIEAQRVHPVLRDLSDRQIDVLKHRLGEVVYNSRIRQHA